MQLVPTAEPRRDQLQVLQSESFLGWVKAGDCVAVCAVAAKPRLLARPSLFLLYFQQF